ncbi:MAG: DNA polymerase III subunit gamma/tau [Chloroflexi bacterium]|nr:DNA polymerase III subunit gamma/tau [Chloroflexota bacterium]
MADTSGRALYLVWRPRRFDEVVGQPHVVRTIRNAVKHGTIAHAYLFSGPRGTGKTTMARLLYKAVNCLQPVDGGPCETCSICTDANDGRALDLIEMDAASNRGIDDVRDLREKINYAPAEARYRVYILDEAHQLTQAAWDALLKTLEEPPPHAILVLATTESHKVPATVLSRCQRFDFHRHTAVNIRDRLATIAHDEGIEVEGAVLSWLARAARGGMRDAISLLDQLRSFCGDRIDADSARDVLGLAGLETVRPFLEAMQQERPGDALEALNEALDRGTDLRVYLGDTLTYLRALMLLRFGAVAPLRAELPDEEVAWLEEYATAWDAGRLRQLVGGFGEALAKLRDPAQLLIQVELVVLGGGSAAHEPAARSGSAPLPTMPPRPTPTFTPARSGRPAPGQPAGSPAPQPREDLTPQPAATNLTPQSAANLTPQPAATNLTPRSAANLTPQPATNLTPQPPLRVGEGEQSPPPAPAHPMAANSAVARPPLTVPPVRPDDDDPLPDLDDLDPYYGGEQPARRPATSAPPAAPATAPPMSAPAASTPSQTPAPAAPAPTKDDESRRSKWDGMGVGGGTVRAHWETDEDDAAEAKRVVVDAPPPPPPPIRRPASAPGGAATPAAPASGTPTPAEPALDFADLRKRWPTIRNQIWRNGIERAPFLSAELVGVEGRCLVVQASSGALNFVAKDEQKRALRGRVIDLLGRGADIRFVDDKTPYTPPPSSAAAVVPPGPALPTSDPVIQAGLRFFGGPIERLPDD